MSEYPERAGWQGYHTSKAAADSLENSGRAAKLRERVLKWFADGNVSTTHECAKGLAEPVWSVQPRISEFGKREILERTGETRRNPRTGKQAAVWRLRPRHKV